MSFGDCNLKGGEVKELWVLSVKPYVYEIVNGKRKRSSIFEFDKDNPFLITRIKERAIIAKVHGTRS